MGQSLLVERPGLQLDAGKWRRSDTRTAEGVILEEYIPSQQHPDDWTEKVTSITL
jgi:hypothetical protein